MVLLGEGCYAEGTCKPTVEILKRRGKVLDSQIDSLKAMMKDLQAEASFFDTTASEAAEGLVEISQEYEEKNLPGRASESGPQWHPKSQRSTIRQSPCRTGSRISSFLKFVCGSHTCLLKQDSPRLSEADNLKDEDEEYARMSRLDELEKEELAREIKNGSAENKRNNVVKSDNAKNGDEDKDYACFMSRFDELEEKELAGETENGGGENKPKKKKNCNYIQAQ